jgi:hypothetical protein
MAEQLKIDIIARDKSKQALNSVQGNISRLKSSVFNLRNALIGVGAGAVIKGFFDAGVQIENLGVQLNALFKSAEKGKQALEAVTKFASGTPFELKNIQQGITSLATVRKQAEDAGVSFEELLVITGNTAVILGGDFALASQQIQRSFSSGVSSAELFRERGVKAMAGFKEGVSYNSKQSIIGLKNAFGTGGEYGKLMNDLSKTTFGTLTNLRDAFFLFQVEVSKGFFVALKQNLGDLYATVQRNTQNINEFGAIIGAGLSKAINATASTVKFLKDNMKILIETIKILIAYKLITFFINLASAIRTATVAMLAFNSATKKNLLIAGGAILLSQLDKIIKKINEIRGLTGDDKLPSTEEEKGISIKKSIPEATMLDKLKFQFEVLKQTIQDLNKGELEKFQDKFKKIGEIIGTSLNNGIKTFSDTFARSVILGEKLSDAFKNIAQQLGIKILSALIEVLARKSVELAIEKLITKEKEKQVLLSKTSSGKGFFNSITSLFSGGGSGLFQGGFGGARASGGSVSKGQPYLVGERGAELFIPNSTGQIAQTARGMGNGQTTVNFNINTLDARGFDELLVRNRGTITQIINSAVNERGSKNLI